MRIAVITRDPEGDQPVRGLVTPLLPVLTKVLRLPPSPQAPFSPPATPGLSSHSAHHIPGATAYLHPLRYHGLDTPFHEQRHLQSQKLKNEEDNPHRPGDVW